MNKYTLLAAILLVGSAQAATTIKIATVAPDGTAWMREMRSGAEAVSIGNSRSAI